MRTEDFLVLGRISLQQNDAAVAKHQGGPGTDRREQLQESPYPLLVFTLQCAETLVSTKRVTKII